MPMVTKKVECKDLCDDVSFIKFQLRNVLRLRLGFGRVTYGVETCQDGDRGG